MKEEEKIKQKCGKTNPFNIPENYFETFLREIPDKLPEREAQDIPTEREITVWERIRPWFYMAAMFAGMLLTIRYMIHTTAPEQTTVITADTDNEQISDEYIESIMDLSMMDDYTLYQYLTEADADAVYN